MAHSFVIAMCKKKKERKTARKLVKCVGVKMDYKFSVLMSVYIKEKPTYFYQCIKSIWKQTLPPNEIVLVKDGAITNELENMIEKCVKESNIPFVIVSLKSNKGLGLALAEGLKYCSNELVARMDTDDICAKQRFEWQMEAFRKYKELDICGGQILEFEGNLKNIISRRTVPLEHKDICKYQKLRSAFNHMTVMFKKSSVLYAGNYQNALLMEDDLLWCNMLRKGAIGANLPKNLVYVRVGEDMIRRRGGFSYFTKYRHGRRLILNTGYITYIEYALGNIIQLMVSILPNKIRKIVFKRLLR